MSGEPKIGGENEFLSRITDERISLTERRKLFQEEAERIAQTNPTLAKQIRSEIKGLGDAPLSSAQFIAIANASPAFYSDLSVSQFQKATEKEDAWLVEAQWNQVLTHGQLPLIESILSNDEVTSRLRGWPNRDELANINKAR